MTDENIIRSSRGRSIFNEFLAENFASDHDLPDKFDKLTELYLSFNSIINISAIKNIDDIYIKHYLDSITPYKHFFGSCCDVGCGGGFPTIPLAMTTKLDFLGIDGVGKKLNLINLVSKALDLPNLGARHARSEDLSRQNVSFDTVCARAVADTDKVLSFCAPLARSGGKIILYKSQNEAAASTATEKKYKVVLSETIDYSLYKQNIDRRLFIYTKL